MNELKEKMSVVMLPTEKATGYIYQGITTKKLEFSIPNKTETCSPFYIPQHLYICSNREIKEGDWMIWDSRRLEKQWEWKNKSNCLKIEASTNKSLNLPEPSIDFIKKYVEKQGNIKEVMIEMNGDYDDMYKGWYAETIKIKVRPDNTIIISKVEEKVYTIDELLNFVEWYSGMTKDKIIKQLNKYESEIINN